MQVRLSSYVLTVALAAFISTPSSAAKIGSLDTSWGTNGVATVQFPGSGSSVVQSVSVGTDNRVVVGGYLERKIPAIAGITFSEYDGVIQALSATGAPDASFGTNGTVQLDDGNFNYQVVYLKVKADGKIFGIANRRKLDGMAAFMTPDQNQFDVVFFQLNKDGSFDSNYGTNGLVLYHRNNNADTVGKVTPSTDGKLLLRLSEFCTSGNSCPSFYYLSKFDFNGNKDLSYGLNGEIGPQPNAEIFPLSAYDVFVLKDGSEIFGAQVAMWPNGYFYQRFLASGELDTSFGSNVNGSITLTSTKSLIQIGQTFPLTANGLSLLVYGVEADSLTDSYSLFTRKYFSTGEQDSAFITNLDSTLSTTATPNARPVKEYSDGKILFQSVDYTTATDTQPSQCKLTSFRTLADATIDKAYAPLASTQVTIPGSAVFCNVLAVEDGAKGKQVELVQQSNASGPQSYSIIRYSGGALNTVLVGLLGLLGMRRKLK